VTAPRSEVLTPNDLFLLAAAMPSGFPSQGGQPSDWVRAPDFSWERALDSAASNRIAAAAARLALSEPLAPYLTDSLRERWRELRERSRRRADGALQQLHGVAKAMAERGVVPLLYKGLDFQALCYPDATPRSFNDIDVIVRPEQAAEAAAALYAEGYDLPPGTPPLDYYRRFHLHAIFLDRDRVRLPVELHWAIDSPHAGSPDVLPHVFDAATPDPEFGGVLRPDPVDALALMASHLEKHLGLSATLPTREARLESVIECHGLLWLLDAVLWMRARGAAADGERVVSRMRELAAEAALTTTLRLALDLDAGALPKWAAQLGERMPGAPSLVTRLVYPDLQSGGPPGERAVRARAWGFRTLPEVGFAPISALQALLPSPRVPGTHPPSLPARLRRIPGQLGLIVANAVAVVRWRVGRWRSERRERIGALEPGASPHPPGE
jgi:hypothetical protein